MPLDELELDARQVAVLDPDDGVVAGLGERLADQLADLRLTGRDGRHARDLLALAHGHRLDVSRVRDDLGHGELDATAQRERVGAGRDVAQAVADDRLSQQRRRRGPVAGDVVGLARTTVP